MNHWWPAKSINLIIVLISGLLKFKTIPNPIIGYINQMLLHMKGLSLSATAPDTMVAAVYKHRLKKKWLISTNLV